MNLLFIQGGSRLKYSDAGRWYTDPNFTPEIWNRYLEICDRLTIILREEKVVYNDNEARTKFNEIPQNDRIEIVPLDDFTRPKWNYFNISIRRRVKNKIFESVKKCDKVIIRSCSDYTYYCYRACKRYKKAYYFEVTGFPYEGLYYQSFLGKMIAIKMEKRQIVMAMDAAYALYVTKHALQNRYPSNGKMMGCSDVEIVQNSEEVLINKLTFLKKGKKKLVLGTCGRVADKNKGQQLVIKALAKLKALGINFEYQLVGFGKPNRLKKIAQRYGVEGQLSFCGGLPHSSMMAWYDGLDIYVQPSYSEGLSRAIVEAMSKACPVICSDAGGNIELIDNKFVFPRGDDNVLADKIALMLRDDNLIEAARTNFAVSKNFERTELNHRRLEFLKEYINVKNL